MASYLTNLVSATLAAINTFRTSMVTSPAVPTGIGLNFDEFGQFDNRRGRYQIYWAFYENSAYDAKAHAWAGQYKTHYALYKNTRGCYNPFFRLGEFWANHLWGGHLNPLKQDGRIQPSGLPIITDNEALRPAIGQLWQDSNWESNKEIICRLGAVHGDVAIRIDDDMEAGKVRMHPVNANTIRWVRRDRQGNVDGYMLEELRPNPDVSIGESVAGTAVSRPVVVYTESCWAVEGTDLVHFETFKDGVPYPWNGISPSYDVPYGFVPLVLINHMRVMPDYDWGWSELQAGLTKGREADHVASNLHSQLRKASDPRFMLSGVQAPSQNLAIEGEPATDGNPYPGDAEIGFLYAGLGATATPLLFSMDVQFTSLEIQNQIQALEKDYPELRYDSARVAGDASAKALREVRKTAEAKVHSRRVGYDNALVRAHKMALSMGAYRGYPGYEDFTVNSFVEGELDHSIGERTVFLTDPLDRIEEETAFWNGALIAKNAGAPLVIYLQRAGWNKAEIKEYQTALQDQQEQAVEQAQKMIAMQPPKPSAPDQGGGAPPNGKVPVKATGPVPVAGAAG